MRTSSPRPPLLPQPLPDPAPLLLGWAIARLERDFAFACPVQDSARTLTTLPGRNSAASTFAYFYSHVLFIVDIVDLFKPYRCGGGGIVHALL